MSKSIRHEATSIRPARTQHEAIEKVKRNDFEHDVREVYRASSATEAMQEADRA